MLLYLVRVQEWRGGWSVTGDTFDCSRRWSCYLGIGQASIAAAATEVNFSLAAPSRASVDMPWMTAMVWPASASASGVGFSLRRDGSARIFLRRRLSILRRISARAFWTSAAAGGAADGRAGQ